MSKYLPWAIIVILAACLLLSMQTCNRKNQTIADTAALSKKLVDDTCKYYAAKNGGIVSENTSLKVTMATLKDANDDLTTQLKNMKISTSSVVYIDRDIEHTTIHDTIHHDTVKLNKPVVFADSSNRWYHIKGVAALTSTALTSIKIFDTCYTVQMTNGKTGIAHKNPYIITTNILSLDIAKPTPFLRKFWVDVGIGAIGAIIGLHYLGVKP